MKKKILQGGRILSVGVLLACLMGLLVPAAHAAQPEKIMLTVRQVLTATGAPPETTFSYKLTPELASNPMPGQRRGGLYLFHSGNGRHEHRPHRLHASGPLCL